MEAAENADRVRPKIGRQAVARGAGMIAGGGVAGGVMGILAGGFLGGVMDSMISQGLTSKVVVARGMNRLAKALRKGDNGAAMAAMRNLAALTKQIPKLNALLAQNQQEQP
jgi:predicted lipid-binding transport protein (Tim44 family)